MRSKRFFKTAGILLLFVIQILFLLAIFRENTSSYLILAFISSLSILTLYAYRKVKLHHHEIEFESISMILWVMAGTFTTYLLNHKLALGPIIAVSLTGLLASFIPNINKDSIYLKQLPPAIYCGAFVGMSGSRVANDFYFVLTAAFFTGVLLVVSKSLLRGVGGRLGTLAFSGVVMTYILIYLLK